MRGVLLVFSVFSVFILGCAGKSPEEHLMEKDYCERYTQEEMANAFGDSSSYQASRLYRTTYDTCMHKLVGERSYGQ